MKNTHKLKGIVWLYQGNAPWHFVTIAKEDMKQIHMDVVLSGGFKSIKVKMIVTSYLSKKKLEN